MRRLAGKCKGRCDEKTAVAIYRHWHKHFEAFIRTPLDAAMLFFVRAYRAFKPCNVEIPDYPLTPTEEAAIAGLSASKVPDVRPEHLATVARMLLRAKCHADKRGLPRFWLGNGDIAHKLGVSINTASRIRAACVGRVVRVTKPGHTGFCTEFELLPEWEPIYRGT